MQGEVLLSTSEGGGVSLQEGVVSRQGDNRGTPDNNTTPLSLVKTTTTMNIVLYFITTVTGHQNCRYNYTETRWFEILAVLLQNLVRQLVIKITRLSKKLPTLL